VTAAPQRAAARPARPAPARRGAGRQRPTNSGAAARWSRVALLVLFVLVGLPLAHAVWGELVALLGGAVLLGFWLGRWTAPG
jgi:hypothetical protein